MTPYIGMTDVPSYDWLWDRLRVFKDAGGDEIEHQLHAGVMMSHKSLNGLSTKYGAVWPKNHDIAGIFAMHHADVLNVLHYADYDGLTTLEDLAQAIRYGGPNLDGLQLDMPWPSPQLVRDLKKLHPEIRIILQVGRRAFGQLEGSNGLIERLEGYGNWINDVLLDLSGGMGSPMDAEALRPHVEAVRKRRPQLGVTVAGGLGPETLQLVAPLARDFPKISIDAQGQLRPDGDSKKPIDTERVDKYLREAVRLFRSAIPDGTPV